ncbi:hypothetical protein JCM8097_005954 [Rhodosporidiobolus ruineniae]
MARSSLLLSSPPLRSLIPLAPKRKAAPSASTEPAPKKRNARQQASTSTADTASSATSKPKKTKSTASTTKASTSKAKGKKKEAEVITLSSSDADQDDDSSSDVTVEPKPKKKAAALKKTKASKETKTPAKKSKAALAAYSLEDDLSTSAPTDVAPVKKKPAAKKKATSKPLTWDQAFPLWWASFAEDEDAETMGGEGIERLFEEMELSMEGVHPFILAWKVKAPPGSFGSFRKADFEAAFKPQKIDTSAKLSSELLALESALYPPSSAADEDSQDSYIASAATAEFRSFYAFCFPFLKNEGSKSLPPEMAIAVLGVVLAPRFELAKGFVEFATAQGDKFKAMSLDSWTQLFDFCEQVAPDLTGWSEDDAWPSIIDSFVEWKKAQPSS